MVAVLAVAAAVGELKELEMTVRLYALLPLLCMVGMGAAMWFIWRYAGKGVRDADRPNEAPRERSGIDD